MVHAGLLPSGQSGMRHAMRHAAGEMVLAVQVVSSWR